MSEIDILYKEFHHSLLGFIRKRIFDKNIAEDLLHDVFLKIIKNRESIDSSKNLTAWVYSITRNTIIDHFRKADAMNFTKQVLEDLSIEEKRRRNEPFASQVYKKNDTKFARARSKNIRDERDSKYITKGNSS